MNHEQPDGPTPPRGLPREQYARTYVLLPPLAGAEWARAVIEATWDLKRWTLGGSADDAGIGDLDYRRVFAVNPAAWPGPLGVAEFFEEFYPDIQYIAVEAETPEELIVKLGELAAPEQPPPDHSDIALCMNDQRWIAHIYGEGQCHTVGAQGCWITDCAMAQRYFGIDPEATPLTVDAALTRTDYNLSCSMKHTAMPKLGLEVAASTTDLAEVRAWLDQGNVCFAEVLPKSLQHFVMVTAYRGDKFWMVDSWKNVQGWLSDYYVGFESGRLIRQYEEPEPPEPPALHLEPISFHIQSWQEAPDLDRFISEVKPAVVKLVEGMEQAYHVKELSPDTQVVFRHVTDHQGRFVLHPDGPHAGARAAIAEFGDSLMEHQAVIDYVETPANEQIGTHDIQGIKDCVAFDVAFCEVLADMGFPARPVTLTAAVGNPDHGAETELLIPAVRATIMAGGALGYHTYWGCNPHTGRCTMTDGDWEHYAGRALESWDPTFRAAGLFPKYIFGEGGPIGIAATGNAMNYLAGWRHSECLNGDRDKLVEQVLEFRRRVNVWNTAHQNRALALTLFTVFFGWEWFQYRKEEMNALRMELA